MAVHYAANATSPIAAADAAAAATVGAIASSTEGKLLGQVRNYSTLLQP
jgi:hypothetical protein